MPNLWTIEGICASLGISRTTFHNRRKDGTIPAPTHTRGRQQLWDVSSPDIKGLLEDGNGGKPRIRPK